MGKMEKIELNIEKMLCVSRFRSVSYQISSWWFFEVNSFSVENRMERVSFVWMTII